MLNIAHFRAVCQESFGTNLHNLLKFVLERKMVKLGVPRLGIYSATVRSFFEELGIEVVMSAKVTPEIIKPGVMNSSDMMCYPFKVTLGQQIWALENGATDLIMFDTCGLCRFKHYHQIQEHILRNLGYRFTMHALTMGNFISKLSEVSGAPLEKVMEALVKMPIAIHEVEQKVYGKNSGSVRVGIIGEFYTMIEKDINFEVVDKLQKMGANVHMSITLSEFVGKAVRLDFLDKREEKEKARRLLSQEIGGHGFHSIYNTFWYSSLGFDGIIHLMPLSCFPQGTYITGEGFIQREISELKAGDKVLTHKGRFRKVVETYCHPYDGKLINIDCGGLINFDVTPEHPIFSAKRQWGWLNPKFNDAKVLKRGDFIAIPKTRVVERKEEFELNLTNPSKPKYADLSSFVYKRDMLRLLGYYLAEGSLGYDKGKGKKYLTSITFTLNANEDNLALDIESIVRSNLEAGIHRYTHPHRSNTLNLNIYNRSLAYALAELGGQYCDKKTIHPQIMLLEPKLQLEIAKGFFRGDGHLVDKYGETRYTAVTTSPTLASQLFWILNRNAIKASLRLQKSEKKKPAYFIRINYSDGIKRLGTAVETRIRNERFISRSGYFLVPIKGIAERSYSGKVYNLQVEGDNSYIANYLAVHNCMPESTVEPLIDYVADKHDIPVYRFAIDENLFEVGFMTRLSTFVSMLKRRKR